MGRLVNVLGLYVLWRRAEWNRQLSVSFGIHLALMERLVVDKGPALETNPVLMEIEFRKLAYWRVGGLSFPVKAWEVKDTLTEAGCLGFDRVTKRLVHVRDILMVQEMALISGGNL